MISPEKPSRAMAASDLAEAPFAEVLLYGLTLGEDDPALGVLRAARNELSVVTNLLECTLPGADLDVSEMAPVLENIGRRLDVAIEMIHRARRRPPAAIEEGEA